MRNIFDVGRLSFSFNTDLKMFMFQIIINANQGFKMTNIIGIIHVVQNPILIKNMYLQLEDEKVKYLNFTLTL